MQPTGRKEVIEGLTPNLARLWRYGLVLSGARDVADDLVQATCVRALERAHQFQSGTRLDRWLFSIIRSIWLNELRSRRCVWAADSSTPARLSWSMEAMRSKRIFLSRRC